MFITFEAGEGAGKSTQARLLAENLRTQGYDVVLTREPGGTPLAEELRALVVTGDPDRMDHETELLIFTAARRDHLRRVIEPALASGKIVICDRYLGSTHALQGAAGTSAELIDDLHAKFCGRIPDLTLFLRVDPQAALDRGLSRNQAGNSAESRFEVKGSAFHDKVCAIFEEQCDRRPEWSAIDGNGSIEDVSIRILEVIKAHPAFQNHAIAA